jgi:hypothetical protein
MWMWMWMWMWDEAAWVCCSCGGRERAPQFFPVLTLAHGQPWWQQHRRWRRAGPGCGTAGQHNADDAVVRLGIWSREKTMCVGVPIAQLAYKAMLTSPASVYEQSCFEQHRRSRRAGATDCATVQQDARRACVRLGPAWVWRLCLEISGHLLWFSLRRVVLPLRFFVLS